MPPNQNTHIWGLRYHGDCEQGERRESWEVGWLQAPTDSRGYPLSGVLWFRQTSALCHTLNMQAKVKPRKLTLLFEFFFQNHAQDLVQRLVFDM